MTEKNRQLGLVSFVVPTYNEDLNIDKCLKEVIYFCESRSLFYEIIVIDNRSDDRTFELIQEWCIRNRNVKAIRNSKNFGPHNSPFYGFLQTSGDVVVPMVADFQTPISAVSEFLRKWEEGFDIVLGVRASSKVSISKKINQILFYKFLKLQTNKDFQENFIGFGLYDKKIVEALRQIQDPAPFFRGMVQDIGFNKCVVNYEEPARANGKSKQTLMDKLEYTFLGITSFGIRPVVLIIATSAIFSVLSAFFSFYFLIMKIANWDNFFAGISPVLVYITLLGSLQFLAIGVISLYISTILKFVKNKPLVIEDTRINFD